MRISEDNEHQFTRFTALDEIVKKNVQHRERYLWDIPDENCQFQREEKRFLTFINCWNPLCWWNWLTNPVQGRVVAKETLMPVAQYWFYRNDEHKYLTNNLLVLTTPLYEAPRFSEQFFNSNGTLIAIAIGVPDNISKPKEIYSFDLFRVKLVDQEEEYLVRENAGRYLGVISNEKWITITDSSGYDIMAGAYGHLCHGIYISKYDENTELLFIILLHYILISELCRQDFS